MLDSLRYINMIKGINLVNKGSKILLENFSFEKYKYILQYATNDENRYLDEKWNLNYYDNGGKYNKKVYLVNPLILID